MKKEPNNRKNMNICNLYVFKKMLIMEIRASVHALCVSAKISKVPFL